MDSKFSLPGTRFRFGLDPILGLMPGIGDFISYGISGIIIYYVSRYGASRKVILKMIGNTAVDAVIGSIPLLGNIFDFVYKANERNLRLLQEHYEEGKHEGSGRGYIIFFISLFVITMLLVLVAVYFLVWWVISLF